ncbi:hypothetical protein QUF73_02630 [Cytobacillus sp. NJ13]|nr:hypothetical protein [Cytobacillus sp. NJ13]
MGINCHCKRKPCCCSNNKIRNVSNPTNNLTFNNTVQGGQNTSFSTAFGNFFRSPENIILESNQAMEWTNTGASSGGVFLSSPTQIHVTQAGFYYVEYTVSVFMATERPDAAFVGIFINNTEVPNRQSRGLIFNGEPDRFECTNVTLGSIFFIPENALVELRNIGPQLQTCGDNGVASSVSLIKLSS